MFQYKYAERYITETKETEIFVISEKLAFNNLGYCFECDIRRNNGPLASVVVPKDFVDYLKTIVNDNIIHQEVINYFN